MDVTPRRIAGYGWRKDSPDQRDHRYATPASVLRALPPSVDLRGGMPPVYAQLSLGSCTGNALAAAVAYDLRIEKKVEFTPSRLFIYYNERAIEGTTALDVGAEIRDGVQTLYTTGVCDEAIWPYDPNAFATRPPLVAYASARLHKLTRYLRVTQTMTELKGALADGFPVVFGFSVYESFESPDVARSGNATLPSLNEQLLGGHCVLLVGYDDSIGRYIARNSWGPDWGMSGYFTLPYAYLLDSNLASDFWTLRFVA